MPPARLSREPLRGHSEVVGKYLTPTERRELARLSEERALAIEADNKTEEGRLSSAILELYERGNEARLADIKLQTNEQIRSSATFLNGMAIATFSVGALTPMLGALVPGSPYSNNLLPLAQVSGGCFPCIARTPSPSKADDAKAQSMMNDPISQMLSNMPPALASLTVLGGLAFAALVMGLIVYILTVTRASRAYYEVEAFRDELEMRRSGRREAY
jgi:hypothetical protein